MPEKQPSSTSHEAPASKSGSFELPRREVVTLTTEHVTRESPEVASFHIGRKDMQEASQQQAGLYHVIDTSKLDRIGNYYKYDGYFFDVNRSGDYLVVSSTNDGSETRRGGARANFDYMYVNKGGRLDIGRETNSDITPDVNDGEFKKLISIAADNKGNLSFLDIGSANGTTLHMPEGAALYEAPAKPAETDDVRAEAIAAHEFLTRSHELQLSIRGAASSFIESASMVIARGRNAATSEPRNAWLELKRDRAQSKYDRKAAKQGTSMFNFVNRIHDMAAARAQDKLNRSELAYSGHAAKMDERIDRVIEGAERRRDVITESRENIAKAAILAEERKIERTERQRLRFEIGQQGDRSLSYTERQKIIDTFIEKNRARIRTAAIKAAKQKARHN